MTIDKKTMDRFRSKLKNRLVVPALGECWEWTGALSPKGYGRFRLTDNTVQAHRFAYEHLGNNSPPGDLHVCHHCNNPKCCNPSHLFLGTNADNMADRDSKGRCAKGNNHYRSILNEEAVAFIREVWALPEPVRPLNQTELADMHGINRSTVNDIVLRRTWKHVP